MAAVLCRAVTQAASYVPEQRPCARVATHKFRGKPACYAHAERARSGKKVVWTKAVEARA